MKIFVDTSAFKSYFDKSDRYHKDTLEIVERVKKKGFELITTDYVFDETITLIRIACDFNTALKFGKHIIDSNVVSVISVDREIFIYAWKIFEKYSRVKLSFTDCTSFAVMKKYGIKKYFSFDNILEFLERKFRAN